MISSSEQSFVGLEAPHTPYPSACVHELVSAVALESPHSIAIGFGEQQLTYAELDDASTRLAHALQLRGAKLGTLVALLVDRSPAMAVSLLAILKSGAGYVPLDPSYPPVRLTSMLALSGASILLTETAVVARLNLQIQTPMLLLDQWQAASPLQPVSSLATCTDPDNTAYVIFTSGSTGQPKGVEITHRALVNLLWALKHIPGMTAADTVLAITSISFDIAAAELLLPLVVGARVELATYEEAADPLRIMARLEASKVTILQATPVTWRLLIRAGWARAKGLCVWCGGEEMTRSLAGELLARSPNVWNLYGPTETTVWSAACKVTPALTSGRQSIPLGAPLANTGLYVLDEELSPVAAGQPGELYIGGLGLAKSYWQRPDLTAQSFPTVTLADGRTLRLYKTGDRVRPQADGALEFLGRLDRQIKLRGFRIELGDVEQAAATHPDVGEVVVTRVEDNERGDYLAAHVVPSPGRTLKPAELREHIAQALPQHMVPSAVCLLDRLPVTPNGKIDSKQLPKPTEQQRAFVSAEDAPHHDLEVHLATLWRETLRASTIGRNDNFFAAGGDSLMATQLVAKLSKRYGRRCSIASLLQSPTIASYASFLAGDQVPTYVVLQQGSPRKQTRKIFWMANPERVHRLANLLEDQPFYSMLLSGKELAQEAPLYPMERLAERMIEQILEHQSGGEYYIGGFCQNALLAYEVSRQLQARGRTVPLLIMIDPDDASFNPKTLPFLEATLRRVRRERFHLSTMMQQPLGEWVPYLQRRVEGIRFVLEEKKWHRIALEGSNTSERAEALDQALFVSRLAYQPQPYHGRVLFIEPTLRPGGNEQETLEEWTSLVPNGEWRYVLGDHLGLFASPGVLTLSQEVQRALDETLR